jgi:hypothetical protein
MSSSGSNPMDAVSALMQERQRFEAWITALEEKRSITPPHVYERVRGDYEVRLREVVQKLVGRTTELKEMVAALTARLAKLQTDENAKRDERYEAELRATVGEFETGQWEKLRGSIDETIARLASERTGVSTELARVQQILSMAGAAASAAVAAHPPGTLQARPPEPASPAPGSNGPPSAGVGRPQGGRFDELAFLSSVVESGAGTNGTGSSSSGRHTAQPPASNGAPPSSVPPVSRPPSGRQPVQAPPAAAPARPTGANQPVITKPENADGAVPSYLRDVPTETNKTLKCNECGTMNSPTEWYCERCGGELAAM